MLAGCGHDEDNVPSGGCLRRSDVAAQESQSCERFLLLWSTRLGRKKIRGLCHQISHPLIISPSGTQLTNDLHLVAMLQCVFDENHLAMLSKRCNGTTRGFIGGGAVGQHAPDVLNPARMQLRVISECLKVCAL